MKDAQPRTIYLKDYRAPDYWIDRTDLKVDLHEGQSRVEATLSLRVNEAHWTPGQPLPPLELQGSELVLEGAWVDGVALGADEYQLTEQGLVIQAPSARFELRTRCRIEPQNNTSLEGLYKSNGMFCTQCEAEGFRKITYYLDRPDVMSVFSCRISADQIRYPVLLSNGNEIDRGVLEEGRHWVQWHDPFPKPAYLFALVAGDLQHVSDQFVTRSGRTVTLQLYTEPRNIGKCDHAIDSLKRAMRWDEEVYGREYDLDIFMIVAVDHFNMGAMENKGLNIFNSSCVLASADTATDASFQRIEAIVAHEYFHNWSGNRVTCRDWFQLSLKEGFTVFRDAEFSADMNSRAVKRIEDVSLLRTAQFAEDAGPMAHPVRPDSYMEISNFYTLTVYEKGAEVVRMIHRLLGAEAFRRGSDLYFERHDGQAVTVEDFVRAMEEASGIDLTQFRRWYEQAGTPRVTVSDSYDSASGRYSLHFSQSCPATPGQVSKLPFHIPIAVGLLDAEGHDLLPDSTRLVELTEAQQTVHFEAISERPVPSLLRGFSAPVKLSYDYSDAQLAFLMANDSDAFNRWDASQQLCVRVLQRMVPQYLEGTPLKVDGVLTEAFSALLRAPVSDPAALETMLVLPAEAYLAEISEPVEVEAIHAAREALANHLAERFAPEFEHLYRDSQLEGAYQPTAEHMALRSLKNAALGYLARGSDAGVELAHQQYRAANNMTDRFRALATLVHCERGSARALAKSCLQDFYDNFKNDPQVIELWLSVQASCQRDGALERVQALMAHEAFDAGNPNKLRSLIGVFCSQNSIGFHSGEGAGYRFLADQVIELDQRNPQIASRLVTPLTRLRKYPAARQQQMREQLQRIFTHSLSPDLYEVVSKSLQ
ncbi:aminopeptidase N [Aestuariirhabdus litorea]|uniref:Aminopeptidase N n=1 Tax=Aestuariirhabdus litorea TaxID=2528527 RepID=A0A3P3VPD8_9GAMM|nr:aminopeptidase N [Aestuariirhabdus litorea]RRJ84631.1 aminopeptidase N [Aestuariirhabdus litorea]RWW97856.1 aminopeptidase N [Endozoicomonadaceae bacterium GTF-13]